MTGWLLVTYSFNFHILEILKSMRGNKTIAVRYSCNQWVFSVLYVITKYILLGMTVHQSIPLFCR